MRMCGGPSGRDEFSPRRRLVRGDSMDHRPLMQTPELTHQSEPITKGIDTVSTVWRSAPGVRQRVPVVRGHLPGHHERGGLGQRPCLNALGNGLDSSPAGHPAGSTFHVFGRSLPQKTLMKSSSRTMLCSWQPGHRRNTTSWVKPEGRPSPASSRARATSDQEVTSGQYPVDWLLTSLRPWSVRDGDRGVHAVAWERDGQDLRGAVPVVGVRGQAHARRRDLGGCVSSQE